MLVGSRAAGGPSSKPGRGTKKIPVIGAVERGGSVAAKVTRKGKLKGRHLRAFVKDRVDTRRASLITDEYKGMCCNFQKEAGERWVGSSRRRLMQPPRTAC